ncbi:MAG: branched-chain amino acid ABC transporter permease, partial [Chloroflexota bacterium]
MNNLTRERRLTIILSLVFIGFLAISLFSGRGTMNTLTEFLYLLALAQLWNLLAGYAGLVSVGQQAWIGLGAYALLALADDFGVPIFIALLLAGAVCAILAYPTALLVFRLRGGYFAIGTWVVAEVFRLVVTSSTEWLGGGLGRSLLVVNHFSNVNARIVSIYILAVLISFGSIALGQYLMQ